MGFRGGGLQSIAVGLSRRLQSSGFGTRWTCKDNRTGWNVDNALQAAAGLAQHYRHGSNEASYGGFAASNYTFTRRHRPFVWWDATSPMSHFLLTPGARCIGASAPRCAKWNSSWKEEKGSKKHQAYQQKATRRRVQKKAAAEEGWWDGGGNTFVIMGGFSDGDSSRGSRRKRKAAGGSAWSFNVKIPRGGGKGWGRGSPLEQLFAAAESGRLQELLWMDQWWRFGQDGEAAGEGGKQQGRRKGGAGTSSQSASEGPGDSGYGGGYSGGGYEEGWYDTDYEGPGTRSSGRRSKKRGHEGEHYYSYSDFGGSSSSSSSSSFPGKSHERHLKVLGLPVHEQLTKDSLKQAFHKAAKLWHPDRHMCPVAKEDAARQFKDAAEAYEALSLTVN